MYDELVFIMLPAGGLSCRLFYYLMMYEYLKEEFSKYGFIK
jgi:hypothetical protein